MKSRFSFIIAGVILSMLVAAGCGGIQTRGGGGGSTPAAGCPGGPTKQSSLDVPGMGDMYSILTPHFHWLYNENGCIPDSFIVHLKTGPYFADDIGATVAGGQGFTFTWQPSTPLEPGREYAWGVEAVGNGITGPYSGDNYFFTGPACISGSLVAPVALSPLNNWMFDDLGDFSLKWWYPDDCLPDSYGVDLSTSLVFDGSPLNGGTSDPSLSWGPGQPLTDCTRYYWQVRAYKDDQPGPYTQVYTFRVAISGGCPAETRGLIQGTVWEDQCAGPDAGTPMPDPLPLGCVMTNSNSIFTNQTYDPGEPGIPGLIVTLGQGTCPSTGYRAVETGPDGMFNFYDIPAGTYCVSVDGKDPTNMPILVPGNWTFPQSAVGYILADQTVTLAAGQDHTNVNFGWWYKYGAGWGSTNAMVFGLLWHDECAYTPGDPVPDPLPAGCAIDQWGNVHADAIHQIEENGIPGVVVDIGPGDCPSAGLATAITDANGYYHFSDLPAGKYCLRIDPVHNDTNAAILMPGTWTVIPSGHENMTFRAITLIANHTLSGQDFGWDYGSLPLNSPLWHLEINANCHIAPNLESSAAGIGVAGQTYPIEGISEDYLWYYINFDGKIRCWFGKATGSASGDTSHLPNPLQVSTGVPACSSYADRASCLGNPACTWVYASFGPGFCKAK